MPYKILVVDDEQDVRDLFTLFLTREGYATESAADGIEAFEKIKAERPDLVITDILMPNCDGFELMKKISTLTPPRLPILFVSGFTKGHETDMRENSNFAGFMAKPILRKNLIDVVNTIKTTQPPLA